jgi:hypothetical protein
MLRRGQSEAQGVSHYNPGRWDKQMLTADECLAKAAELSLLADGAGLSNERETLLLMADTWLDLSRHAEWQDTYFPQFGPTRHVR